MYYFLYLWQSIFTVTIGSFGFFNISKTMLLQAVTTLVRWAGTLIFFILKNDLPCWSILIEMDSIPADDCASLLATGESFIRWTRSSASGRLEWNSESVWSLHLLFHVSPFTAIVGDSHFTQTTHLPVVHLRLYYCRRVLSAAVLHGNLRLSSAQWSLHVELRARPVLVEWHSWTPSWFFPWRWHWMDSFITWVV